MTPRNKRILGQALCLLLLASATPPGGAFGAGSGAAADTSRTRKGGTKSPGVAALLSLLVPGLGQAYVGGGASTEFFLFAEGALWAGDLGFRMLARARDNTFKAYAAAHSGLRVQGKDARFFDDVASYRSLAVRNSVARYLDGPEAELIPDTPENGWEWDSDASLTRFHRLRSASTSARRNALLCVGGLVLNRFTSALQAAYLARKPRDKALGLMVYPDSRGGFALSLSRAL